MIIYGTGEHAKVIYSILEPTVQYFCDEKNIGEKYLGLPVKDYNSKVDPKLKLIIAIGNNKVRKLISKKIGHTFGKAISTSSFINQRVSINPGTQILHNSVLQIDVQIGNHVIINTCASIDHDGNLGDFVHIAPNATLCGNVTVGEGTLIGAGSTIIPGIKIGKWCTIGAGSVILENIPDYCTVVGNPGRIIKRE